MPRMDAETGKFVSTRAHYDSLITEDNDPVNDPPALQAYMSGWDGDALFSALKLTPECRVLEIGVGTGRLAIRALEEGCAQFTGMDLSEWTIERAKEHLSACENVSLISGEFPKDMPEGTFDRIYSSLTFLHIEDKAAACRAIADLLGEGGRAVISLDKERSDILDMGNRAVHTYPDDPENIVGLLHESGLTVQPVIEIERAWLVVADRSVGNK